MAAALEPFQDTPEGRAELVPFLMEQFQGEGACSREQWLGRMAFWWDQNPFAGAHECRGWVLREGGKVVGYLGVIPTLYEDAEGVVVPGLIATTWAVAEGHRNAALGMGMMLQRQSRSALLVDTTPSPEVQALMLRWGWTRKTEVRRGLVMRGTTLAVLAGLLNADLSELAGGLEVTADVMRVRRMAVRQSGRAIQKHITPEYLRWYVASPMREHHFLGVVDGEGVLSSYVVLTPKPVKGLPSWKVMDWFTVRESNRELLALVGHLIGHSPAEHGNWWPLISLTAFLPEDPWVGVSLAYQSVEEVKHFYMLPPTLKGQEIRSVMAEGDWGL